MTYIKKAKAKSQTNFYTNSNGEKKFKRKLRRKHSKELYKRSIHLKKINIKASKG